MEFASFKRRNPFGEDRPKVVVGANGAAVPVPSGQSVPAFSAPPSGAARLQQQLPVRSAVRRSALPSLASVLREAATCHVCRCEREGCIPCTFCDRDSCMCCSRLCHRCKGVFCSFCSTDNYDASWARAFCLECDREDVLRDSDLDDEEAMDMG